MNRAAWRSRHHAAKPHINPNSAVDVSNSTDVNNGTKVIVPLI
jgi:hypothetical protein